MSTKTSSLALEELLTCSICTEIYTKPLTLPCFHTYCEKCLNGMMEYNGIKKDGMECPQCYDYVGKDDLKINFMVKSCLDSYHRPIREQKCDLCSKQNAEFGCVDGSCKVKMCCSCQQIHRKIPSCKNHKILSLKDQKSSPASKPIACKNHSTEYIKKYCVDCKTLICFLCHSSKHNKHKVITTDEALKVLCPSFEKDIQKIESSIRAYEKQIEYFDSQFKAAADLYDEVKAKVINSIEMMKQMNIRKILNAKENYEKIIRRKQSLVRFAKTTIQRTTNGSLLNEITNGLGKKVKKESDESLTTSSIVVCQPKVTTFNYSTSIYYEAGFLGTKCKYMRHFPGNYEDIVSSHGIESDITTPMNTTSSDAYMQIAIVNSEIWVPVCTENYIEVYSDSLDYKRKIPTEKLGILQPMRVIQVNNNSVIVSSSSGLFHLNAFGRDPRLIAEGSYGGVFVDGDILAAHEITANKLLFFERKGDHWVKRFNYVQLQTVSNKAKSSSTVVFNDRSIFVSSDHANKLHEYSLDGQLVNIHDECVSPWVCGIDKDENVLICDEGNKQFKYMCSNGRWKSLNLDGISRPRDIIVTAKAIYVLWRDEKDCEFNMSKFLLNNS